MRVEKEKVERREEPGPAQGSGKGGGIEDGSRDGVGRREKEGASEEVG